MTIGKLRALLARQAHTAVRNIRLQLAPRAQAAYTIELDNDCRQLQFYSIESGDVIRMFVASV